MVLACEQPGTTTVAHTVRAAVPTEERPSAPRSEQEHATPRGDGSLTQDVCATAICPHATRLQCGSIEHCVQGCREMLAVPVCQQATASFLDCIAKERDEHWECDTETRVPMIKDGYCDPQQRDLVKCMESAS